MRVVVIDDDPNICKLINLILSKQGHEVQVANSGEEGLDRVRAQTPDMIICDVVMPGMGGHQFVETVRQETRYAAVPIMMLTAKRKDAEIMEGYRKGADYYLTKPFTTGQLNYGINTLLNPDEPD